MQKSSEKPRYVGQLSLALDGLEFNLEGRAHVDDYKSADKAANHSGYRDKFRALGLPDGDLVHLHKAGGSMIDSRLLTLTLAILGLATDKLYWRGAQPQAT